MAFGTDAKLSPQLSRCSGKIPPPAVLHPEVSAAGVVQDLIKTERKLYSNHLVYSSHNYRKIKVDGFYNPQKLKQRLGFTL